MIEIYVKRIGPALHYDSICEDEFETLKQNQWYKCSLTQPRSLGFHRKFFALVKTLFEYQNKYDSFNVFRKVLIFQAGYFKTIILPDENILLEADSISFVNCDQIKFEKIYNDVLQTGIDSLCYENVSEEEINNQVAVLMGFG